MSCQHRSDRNELRIEMMLSVENERIPSPGFLGRGGNKNSVANVTKSRWRLERVMAKNLPTDAVRVRSTFDSKAF